MLTELWAGFGADDAVLSVLADAAAALGDGGAAVSRVAPIFRDDPYPALDRLFQVRAAAELESIREDRRELVHPAIRDWCAPGANRSATDFTRDGEAVARSAELVRAATAAFDFVVSPIIPTVGFAADEVGLDPSHPLAHCGFTAWANQTAQPAAALRFGFADGMPVGIQVVGPRFADADVLRLTKWLEAARPATITWPAPATAHQGGH
ncbi:amidase family protein [Mycolicibacterium sp. P1-18]|uniref:amidase family protein n=1 Tax=Mycolicibacterium sp. P1-18 TaxID=2024615 RepID=UPI00156700F6|nr:amidase family protein [Mycolicibacterium sp. P1-18]